MFTANDASLPVALYNINNIIRSAVWFANGDISVRELVYYVEFISLYEKGDP
jgi:hypothetical protein